MTLFMNKPENGVFLDKPRIGVLVRRARWSRGFTQLQLSKVSGISRASIAYIENGRIPTATTLARLAVALSVTVDSLLFENRPKGGPEHEKK